MDFCMKVTTSSSDCQSMVNKGVLCSYGFQREEAIRYFEKALTFDSNCVMAQYFIAYNYGSDYNTPDGLDLCKSFDYAQQALEKAQKASSLSDWEKALIEAQVCRFCWPLDYKSSAELCKDYANAMRPIYQQYGDDANIAALFAESLMMLAPWMLWTTPPTIKPAIAETEELVAVLEKALRKDPSHPGLCHFYIHVMELSATPERALPAANELRTCYPDQGHLLHMPSHIDMWVGHYKEAVEVNKKAVLGDEQYVIRTGINNEFYKMYRMHNYHFAVWASMFDGQYATAMEYAEGAEKQLGVEDVSFKLGDFEVGSTYLEAFGSLPWHVLVRFGKWDDIIHRPLKDKDIYAGTVATSHYARGIAYAVMGKLDDADKERKKFYEILQGKSLENRFLFNNVMHDPENHKGILDVAEAVLNGEIEYHKGNYEEAFKSLRLAVERDTTLTYDEPWGWMTPARHVLGALLLEHGEAKEAEDVYKEDLKQYKDNLWSLLGLYQALKQQKKMEEAEVVHALFQNASVRADIKIGASCLCATKLCC